MGRVTPLVGSLVLSDFLIPLMCGQTDCQGVLRSLPIFLCPCPVKYKFLASAISSGVHFILAKLLNALYWGHITGRGSQAAKAAGCNPAIRGFEKQSSTLFECPSLCSFSF